MIRRERHAARPREVLAIVQTPGSRAVAVKGAVIAEAAALVPNEAALARTRSLGLDPIMVLAMVLVIPAMARKAVGREDLALAKVATRLIGVVAQARVKARPRVDLGPALEAFRLSKVRAQGGEKVRTDLARTLPWNARWYKRTLEQPLMVPPKPTHVHHGVKQARVKMAIAVANCTLRSVLTLHLPGSASIRTSATSSIYATLAKAEGEKARLLPLEEHQVRPSAKN